MDHAENISDCEFFLVTRVSKSGGNEHEVNFVVGEHAKEAAITLSVKLLKVCKEIGANLNTVENTVRKLKIENESNLNKLKKLTREKLNSIRTDDDNNNSGITVIQGIFSGLEEEEIRKFAGTKIAGSKKSTVIIIVNSNNDSDATANVVLARNEELLNVDCDKLFKQVSGADGQGGGNPHFVRRPNFF